MKNISGLVKFQTIIRDRYRVRDRIYKEITWLSEICHDISKRLDEASCHNVISKNIYGDNLKKLNDTIRQVSNFYGKISILSLNKSTAFNYAFKISKVRLEIINIVQNIGCCKVAQLVELILNKKFNDLGYQGEHLDLLKIINQYFCPISSELYTLQGDKSYSLDSQKDSASKPKQGGTILSSEQVEPQVDKDSTTQWLSNSLTPKGLVEHEPARIKLTEAQLQVPTLVRLTPFTKGFTLRLNGCKVYLPLKKKLLVINGYFGKTNISSHFCFDTTLQKRNTLEQSLKPLKLDTDFKQGYLDNLSLRDLLVFSTKELVENCMHKQSEIKRIRSKSLSNTIKEFMNMEMEGQRDIISTLLLNPKNVENVYVTHILFDLLSSDSVNNGSRVSEQIYNSLHWSQQKLLSDARGKADSITNDLLKFTEETVPFEKRIILMKTSNNVKAKALEKLKEINNSKGGEGTAKAQQYVEGLLKIPFGIYKREQIIDFISDFRSQTNTFYNSLVKNHANTLPNNHISQLVSDQSDQLQITSSSDIDSFLKEINNYYIYHSDNQIQDKLAQCQNAILKELLAHCKLPKTGKKSLLVERLLTHKEKISLENRIKYKLLPTNLATPVTYPTLNQFSLLQNKWNSYKKERGKFLQWVDQTLDSAVYGMDDAKVEIRRIIGQWINGSSEGYILGFEGPPGTGKTTLAKKGIARCLRDEDGAERPFTFIALGGSTNGSTLEGHNYTYVGSTWGRIVDSLIEAQCMNPIIYIDELDKISRTEHGKELIGILIHLTDPSQNEEFMDKYFSGIKLDISNCLIIFSYNDVTQVDRVLLDRIHRIKIKGLNRHDKFRVAKKHLIPEICKTVGFKTNDIKINEETLFYLIDNYTYEAGARRLKECLFDIIRELNLRSLTGEITEFPQEITRDLVKSIFSNQKRVQIKKIPMKPAVGLINGLYATAAGVGGITVIESFRYLSESRMSLELTGQQGDVMKESMRVSKTVAWNLLPCTIKEKIRKEAPFGIHVHCPEAAQPKDGPSAGVAITVAILSLLSNIPINNKVAVTGEIDLNGNILPIGGLESKIEGAKSAGVELVLCPEENRDDLQKIRDSEHPPEKEGEFRVQMVSTIYQAIDLLLLGGDKCSSLFHHYSTLNLSHNDYLLTFKSMCDESNDLICILDTTNHFNVLYCSKGFPELGWNIQKMYGKSIFSYIHNSYVDSFRKTLQNTKDGESDPCIRLRILKPGDESLVVICNTKKIDNIISCTLRLIDTLSVKSD